ncbi:hypothetical protein Hs30E_06970 [Lactococcus hodotermopsidis]|uniref:N-acetyltransferase domain-containing protein n=1 Tax=Pseudolactococcus hodotermopsidis TaxID=2709157 RepID=A0A6A0BBE2_9LACT|nr:GNAT family N-acetyltransferase [Lactococcus hodotermopsidis]GFH42146.1 hypothetical protein Hs30E_06970 [Lactococcus hodotermopsidis]
MIRKLTDEEVLDMSDFYYKIWYETYHPFCSPHFFDYQTAEMAYFALENGLETGEIFFGKFLGDELVGFISIIENRKEVPDYTWEIHTLYVSSSYQSQGIGTALFQYVRELFLNLKIEKCFLFVVEGNTAKEFYKKMGGVQLSSRRISSRIPEFEAIMGFDFTTK